MFRLLRRTPFLKFLVVAQTALLVGRHLRRLDANDWRRLGELVRRGRGMDRAERDELRRLLGKLEPRAFAARRPLGGLTARAGAAAIRHLGGF
jgi:hypothetical protein